MSSPSQVQTSGHHGPPPGTVLKRRYKLDAVIGRGGASVVYQATDLLLNMMVAVKVLLRESAAAQESGLRNEAVACLRLHHPNIVRAFTYEEDSKSAFLVMEYLEGFDCHAMRRNYVSGRVPLPEVDPVMRGAFDALEYAHTAGVAHHDIKPSNIFLTKTGAVKVCDFGISRTVHSVGAAPSLSLGTPAYMSPERICGRSGDFRSDIYSLGATLYTLLCGRTPFGNDIPGVFQRHVSLQLPKDPSLPPPVYDVIARAMAKAPIDRFQSITEFREALLRLTGPVEEPLEVEATPYPSDDESEDVELTDNVKPVVDRTRVEVPRGMLEIPAHGFRSHYGRNARVNSFYIDALPVSNKDYAEFVAASDEDPPDNWPGKGPPPGLLDYPVVGITLEQAQRFATWKGKRLPTSFEWEAAARAPHGWKFPWGDDFLPEAVHGPHLGVSEVAPIGQYEQNVTELGVRDLIGNVWEWSDVDPDDRRPEEGMTWVFGGSFRHSCESNGGIPRTAVRETNSYSYLGFRCAWEPV